MPEWEEIAACHADLSPLDLRFREMARHHERLLSRATFHELDQKNPLLRYSQQSWPTFISSAKVAEIERLSVALSELIRSVPERLFGNDPGRIARHYALDSDLVSLILAPPNAIPQSISRGDFLSTSRGFQCIEFNLTSNLGGWETSLLADMLLRIQEVTDFIRNSGQEILIRNTLRLLFLHAALEAADFLQLGPSEVNVVLGVLEEPGVVGKDVKGFLAAEYQAAIAEVAPPLAGTFGVCRYDELDERDGCLYFQDGRPVHAIIEWHTDSVVPKALRCFKLGNLLLLNGPISQILSDKRNLALLSDVAESTPDLFDAAERKLILEHIPWIRQALPGPVRCEGKTIDMEDLLRTRRERLVLKKGHSLGGKDVVLGRFTPKDEWDARCHDLLKRGDWVVQEFAESLPYLFQSGDHGCSPHDVVWGPFVFGTTYAGTILRVQPKAWEGIVNLTRGASEGILFEVEDGHEPGS